MQRRWLLRPHRVSNIMNKVHFELGSPESLLVSEEVDMVVVPGTEGDFGVLVGHAPVMTSVRPGVLEILNENVHTKRLFVSGGVCEVTSERCTVLAEESIAVEELDRVNLEERLQNAREDIEISENESDRHRAEVSVQLFEEMLRVAN